MQVLTTQRLKDHCLGSDIKDMTHNGNKAVTRIGFIGLDLHRIHNMPLGTAAPGWCVLGGTILPIRNAANC